MNEVLTKQAYVEIQRLDKRPAKAVEGSITFELRADCVYYTWRVEDAAGKLLGSVSRGVTLRLVPAGFDPFDFALPHALESLKRYQILRRTAFEVKTWAWLS